MAQQLAAEAALVERGRFEGWVKQLRQKVGALWPAAEMAALAGCSLLVRAR